jgi:hypothetical protein
VTSQTTAVSGDWQDEIVYDTLVHNPQVRDILARQIPPASHMTGEDLLEAWGKINKSPISLVPAAGIAQEINSRLGVHTGKSRSGHYPRPIGEVIVSALCVLARDGYSVKEARQASDGCILICTLPSDMFSLAGSLVIDFRRDLTGVSVTATTRIEGQLMDWGKSNRILDDLFKGFDAGV